jgi:hypothetical protein
VQFTAKGAQNFFPKYRSNKQYIRLEPTPWEDKAKWHKYNASYIFLMKWRESIFNRENDHLKT